MKIIRISDGCEEFNPSNIPIKKHDLVFIDGLPFLYDGLSSDHKELIFKRYLALNKMEVKFGEAITSYSTIVSINDLRNGATRIKNLNNEEIEFPGISNMGVFHDGKHYKELYNAPSMIEGEEYLLVGHPEYVLEYGKSPALSGDFIAEVIFRGTICTNSDSPNYGTIISTFDVISSDRILGKFSMKLPKNKTGIPYGMKIFEKIKE